MRWIVAVAMAGALGLATAACSTSPDLTGTAAHRMKAWEQGTNFQAAASALAADVARIQGDLHTSQAGVVKFHCITLGQDAARDHSALPTPDPTLSLLLEHAYEAYYRFATSCVNHDGRQAAVTGLLHELRTGNGEMAKAQQRLDTVLS